MNKSQAVCHRRCCPICGHEFDPIPKKEPFDCPNSLNDSICKNLTKDMLIGIDDDYAYCQ